MLGSLSAARADTNCTGTLTGGVINGNLVVPTGYSCTLNGVTVGGNVTVETGAGLQVNTGSKIGGNITGVAGCTGVFLEGNSISVSGNLQVEDCGVNGYLATGSPPGVTISGNFVCENTTSDEPCYGFGGKIGGNVSFIGNSGGVISMNGATIDGNLRVNGNSSLQTSPALVIDNAVGGNVEVGGNSSSCGAPCGDTTVGGNTIGGNLECLDNTPAVTDDSYGSNTVHGNKLGQCSSL